MLLTRAEIVNGTGWAPDVRFVPASSADGTRALTRAEIVNGTGWTRHAAFYSVSRPAVGD